MKWILRYRPGEHIDYALFGVLPAAIERDILIACGPRSVSDVNFKDLHAPGSVVAENLHSKYPRQIFAPIVRYPEEVGEAKVHGERWHLDINTKELRWESYVKAGYYVRVLNFLSPRILATTRPVFRVF